MKKLLALFMAVSMLFVSFAVADAPAVESTVKEQFVPGQLVAYISNANARNAKVTEATQILETWGYTQTRRQLSFGEMTLKLYEAKDRSAAKNVVEAVRLFNSSMSREAQGVKLMPNYIFKINDNNDPCFNRKDIYRDREGNAHDVLLQWDMKNPGEFGGIANSDLNATEAWKMIPENHEQIIVAVVDSGVDTEHPGLKGRILMKDGKPVGKDTTAWWGEGDHHDDHGHGSHCAGSIAAGYSDKEGMTGSSGPTNVKIISVKSMGKDGSGDLFSIGDGIKWAGAQGADIISLSLGATPLFPEQEPILKEAFDDILNSPELKNAIPIAAAGNNGEDLHSFPAFCEKAIAIGASDHQDKLATFSNFGTWVDVVSPGVNILSLRAKFKGKYVDMYRDAGYEKAEFAVGNGGAKDPYDNRAYYIASGTSMATPNAAGVVAMLLAVNPKLKGNTQAVRKILMETSVKKGSFKIKENSGRIDALEAVKAAKNFK
ncbi:S8 family serine peptidase [Candidatus Uabimicrobium sp. HlEnr_7]|uniref:S8 family peptidase n=1 Tax=Candidatus Uabimicrobium helgolandensis TaxID=3095367 RepID=UPI0035575A5F